MPSPEEAPEYNVEQENPQSSAELIARASSPNAGPREHTNSSDWGDSCYMPNDDRTKPPTGKIYIPTNECKRPTPPTQ